MSECADPLRAKAKDDARAPDDPLRFGAAATVPRSFPSGNGEENQPQVQSNGGEYKKRMK